MSAAEDKNPWLGLARISGDHEENKRLWNGYQKYLLRPNIDEYQRQMENPEFADIVDLSDAEIHSIQTRIQNLPKRMKYPDKIDFESIVNVIEERVVFSGFYFAFSTNFRGVICNEPAAFVQAVFAGSVNFHRAQFAVVNFYGTKFQFAEFSLTQFGVAPAFNHSQFVFANFAGAQLGHVYFKQARFGTLCFSSAQFKSASFEGTEFSDFVIFDNQDDAVNAAPLKFKGAKFFKHPPRFFGRTLHEDTDWTGVTLPNAEAQAALSRDLLEDDKRAYEQLRIKCGALGKVEDEHMFFRREMELTGHLSPWYTRVTYWLYHLVSDYGHSYWRPIAGMGGLWYLWSLFYALHFMARDQLHLCMDRVELLRSAMGLSFANIFAVFGFYRRFPSDLLADPTFVTVLLTVSETLLGFVFLFFLGLGLRTRFRLR